MKPHLRNRRKRLLNLKRRGLLNTSSVRQLAQEDGVSVEAIWMDWNRRKKWISRMVDLRETEEMISEFLEDYSAARETLWCITDEARAANQYSAAVGAMKHVIESLKVEAEFRQSIGIMKYFFIFRGIIETCQI